MGVGIGSKSPRLNDQLTQGQARGQPVPPGTLRLTAEVAQGRPIDRIKGLHDYRRRRRQGLIQGGPLSLAVAQVDFGEPLVAPPQVYLQIHGVALQFGQSRHRLKGQIVVVGDHQGGLHLTITVTGFWPSLGKNFT